MGGPVAAVDPPYRLLASTTVVVGVSPGEGDDEVVVTQQSQGVSVYNVQSSECMRHWAIRSDVRLTHAAILQPRARRVLAVREHGTAFSWSSDASKTTNATEVDMSSTKTMALPILRILHAAPLLDAVCLVTIDGAAVVCDAELRTELARTAAPANKRACRAAWAELLPLPLGGPVPLALAVIVQDANGAAPRLLLHPMRPKGSGDGGVTVPLLTLELLPAAPELPLRPPEDADAAALALSGCCLVDDGEGTGAARAATLAVLWGDGLLQLWDVPAPRAQANGARTAPALTATPRSSRRLGGLQLGAPAAAEKESSGRRTAAAAAARALPPPPCALLALQPPQMLLFTRSSQPGSTQFGAECCSCLQLWETRYGMLLSQRTPDLAQRLAPRSGALIPAAARPLGVALCGGGSGAVALAFEGAVLVCLVRTPGTSVGLAHSLGTAQRTCDALEPSQAGAALRPPLCHAPHVGDLLGAFAPLSPNGRPRPLGGALLGAWRARAERGDAQEEAQLTLLLREKPPHSPASFERALLDYLSMLGYTGLDGRAAPAVGGGGGAVAAGGATPNGKRRKGEATADGAVPNGAGSEPSPLSMGASGGRPTKKSRRETARVEAEAEAPAGQVVPAAAARVNGVGGTAGGPPRGISAHFVAQVCARCLGEKSAEWLQPLRLLMACGAVTAAVHPQLLPALCEARALPLLLDFLRYASDLHEHQLVQLLQITLREVRAKQEHKASAAAEAAAVKTKPLRPFGSLAAEAAVAEAAAADDGQWDHLLDQLIRAPRNDVLLLQALRALSLPDCVGLLHRLLQLLTRYLSSWEIEPELEGAEVPELAQVLGWLNVLLDAHFSQLLLHVPAHALLKRLASFAGRHAQQCASLNTVHGHLALASSRGSLPTRPPLPDYSVELLDF